MCGRYAMTTPLPDLITQFEITDNLFGEDVPRYNIAPGQEVAAIIIDSSKKIVRFRWGLMPPWMKEGSGNAIINARAETLREKPSFRKLFTGKRCLLIANGFFEWQMKGNEKVPVYIKMKNDEPILFAGLYDVRTGADGKKIGTCTIITTGANEMIAAFHERMPVIIKKEDAALWLDASSDERLLLPLMGAYDASAMTMHEVSKAVNLIKNDDPSLILPLQDDEKDRTLF